MSGLYKLHISVAALLALASLAGCGAQSSLVPEAQNIGASADFDLISASGPIIAPAPEMPHGASWFDLDELGDIDDYLDDLINFYLIPVDSGLNELDAMAYMGASANVAETAVLVDTIWVLDPISMIPMPLPVYENRPQLTSAPGEMSYVMYGLRDMPAGETIRKIKVDGELTIAPDGGGLYIGVGDYSRGSWRWFGPYGPDPATWELPLYNLDTASDDQHAYITLAVHGGDVAQIRGLQVEVGTPLLDLDFEWEIALPDLFDLDGFLDTSGLDPSTF